jgi:hypothetical protein
VVALSHGNLDGFYWISRHHSEALSTGLLSNAVKFTPEGGTIGLDVVGNPATECVHLTVWDTGIGIAADDLTRLFQPFVQLDSRLARQYAGTGLGLALVQRMAVLHGGSVSVESTLGQGSRFTISLPWAAESMSDPTDSPERVPPLAERRGEIFQGQCNGSIATTCPPIVDIDSVA